jgi:hypothetical protein
MIFLIEYNRRLGKLINMERFADEDRAEAEKIRLDIELARKRQGVEHEVVLLQAPSEDALRATHRRYFETPANLIEKRAAS